MHVQVTDMSNGSPVAGAEMMMATLEAGQFSGWNWVGATDANGALLIEGLGNFGLRMAFDAEGYEPACLPDCDRSLTTEGEWIEVVLGEQVDVVVGLTPLVAQTTTSIAVTTTTRPPGGLRAPERPFGCPQWV